jgi:hypothetical protein
MTTTPGSGSIPDPQATVHDEPDPTVAAALELLDRGAWEQSPVPAATTLTRTWPDGSVDTLLILGPTGVTYGRRDDPQERLVWQLDGAVGEVVPALNALAPPGTPGAPSIPLDDPRGEIR